MLQCGSGEGSCLQGGHRSLALYLFKMKAAPGPSAQGGTERGGPQCPQHNLLPASQRRPPHGGETQERRGHGAGEPPARCPELNSGRGLAAPCFCFFLLARLAAETPTQLSWTAAGLPSAGLAQTPRWLRVAPGPACAVEKHSKAFASYPAAMAREGCEKPGWCWRPGARSGAAGAGGELRGGSVRAACAWVLCSLHRCAARLRAPAPARGSPITPTLQPTDAPRFSQASIS